MASILSRPQCVKTMSGWHKMVAILQITFWNTFYWMKLIIPISLKFVPESSYKNKPLLVQIMVWHQTGNRLFSEAMMVLVTDASLSPNELIPSLFTLLTHWGRVTHICVSKLTIIGSDHGLSPGRRQAIIWTNAGILLIRPLGTNFSEMFI